MTLEMKQFITPEDLKALQLECNGDNCKTRVNVRLDYMRDLPHICPCCGNHWVKLPSVAWESLLQMRNSVIDVIRHAPELGFSLRLEVKIKGEKNESGSLAKSAELLRGD
jgi:hypothetical protein